MWTKNCPWCNFRLSPLELKRLQRRSGRFLTCPNCLKGVRYKPKNYWPTIIGMAPIGAAAVASKAKLLYTPIWVTVLLGAIALFGIMWQVKESALEQDPVT